MSTPLEALSTTATRVTAESAEQFLHEPGWALLVVTGDPSQRPEAQDLAVVVRELGRRAPTGTRVGVESEPDEEAVKQRFGLTQVPSLLFVRDGKVLSTIPRIQDWAVYARAADVFWGKPRSAEVPS